MKPTSVLLLTARFSRRRQRHRSACRLRAVADAQRQRDSAVAVFPGAELYRAESRADLLRL
jgi:hypothetical protein